MKGAHRVIVESKKIKYDFTIKRNITVIAGDSATGKTVLVDMIREYQRYGADSGVNVSCDCPCRTLDDEDWQEKLERISGSIIFIDEGNRFVVTQKFAEMVQESDNYFVIATRENLPMLPYSIEEIYGFRQSGKYTDAKQKYNELYHLYGEISAEGIEPVHVITEDTNSGYEFFRALSKESGISCESANGKSNIIQLLEQYSGKQESVLVVVDGAAFGAEMRDVYEYLRTNPQCVLYAPESFEWLLLSSNVIPGVDVSDILRNPEEYIDSREYLSWERYFTKLLMERTAENSVWRYSKKKLNPSYLSARVVQSVKKVMRLVEWDAKAEFDTIMQAGLAQAKEDDSLTVDDAFSQLKADIACNKAKC